MGPRHPHATTHLRGTLRVRSTTASRRKAQEENAMHVQPYLFMDGRCEEALTFYERAIGAKVQALMRVKENPDQGYKPPGSGEKIMHAELKIGDTVVMASDGMS